MNAFFGSTLVVSPFHPNAVDVEDSNFKSIVSDLKRHKEELVVLLQASAESLAANLKVLVFELTEHEIFNSPLLHCEGFDPRRLWCGWKF